MRLICPNCGAQYEVDAKVIPESGRDVQCSNCGHTWFQQSAEVDSDLADELGFELPVDDAAPEPSIDTTQVDQPLPQIFDVHDTDKDSHNNATTKANAPVQRSAVSDSVRDILRAEVEYNQNNRPAEPDALETQPDLGLQGASTKDQKGLRDRMARLRGLSPSADSVEQTPVQSAKRRDLLPNIDEINSTLSAASERNDDGTVQDDDTRKERARKTGFRTTFLTLILLVILLILAYIFAPMLAQKVPALAGVLDGFVAGANDFRTWLDTLMTSTSARMNALLGQLNGGS